MFVDEFGRFVVRDLEPDNQQFSGFGLYKGAGGIPFPEDLSNQAPSKVKIRFKKRWELRVDYSEQVDLEEKINSRLVVAPFVIDPNAVPKGREITMRARNVFSLPKRS